MTDAVIDASELESSGKSLNQHSWLTDEERARDTTLLLAKDKTNSIQWRRKKNQSSKEGSAGDSSNSGGATPSYSALLDSGDDARARAYVTKTLFGEVPTYLLCACAWRALIQQLPYMESFDSAAILYSFKGVGLIICSSFHVT